MKRIHNSKINHYKYASHPSKTSTILLALALGATSVECYAMDEAAKWGLGILGTVTTIAVGNKIINDQQEATRKEEEERKRLETQIREEEQKTAAAEKRLQEQEAYDRWFFSLSKEEQYAELRRREKAKQLGVKREIQTIKTVTDIGEAVTAPKVRVYSR
jgi:hypothetical protein